MRELRTAASFLRLTRSQFARPERLREIQLDRLKKLVRHAHETVPFHRERFRRAGVRPEDIRSVADLERIPVTTKAELREADPESLLSSAFGPGQIVTERTSGSTGEPLRIHFDPGYVVERDALFLRGLVSAGYRPGSRVLLLTGTAPRRRRRWLRWRYASITASAQSHRALFDEFRPHVLYGPRTPLRRLAELVAADGAGRGACSLVVTTAERLDGPTRALLSDVFRAPVRDFYGLTETGLLGWECAGCGIRHLSEDATIVELHHSRAAGASRVAVVTPLGLRAMPVLRLRTEDLVVPARPGRCGCGRWLRGLRRVEGRLVDCVHLRDGRVVSPYRLTRELERVVGIGRYQVIQRDHDDFLVRIEPGPAPPGDLPERLRAAVGRAVGQAPRIEVRELERLRVPAGQKFRVVESRIGGRGAGPVRGIAAGREGSGAPTDIGSPPWSPSDPGPPTDAGSPPDAGP